MSSVNRLPKVIKDHKKDSHSRAVVPSGSMSARGTRDLERGPTPDGSPLPIVPSQNQPGQSSVTQELHLHDERQRMDYTSTTNELHMHDSRQQSVHASVSNELHLHDDRQQTVQIGISPHEYGRVIAQAQQMLTESQARSAQLEGFASEIHSQACQQIGELKSIVESLYQSCSEKDHSIQMLSNDLGTLQHEVGLVRSQLQSKVEQIRDLESKAGHAKDLESRLRRYGNIIDNKDSEIRRLMSELDNRSGQLQESVEQNNECRRRYQELEASLAASSAGRDQSQGAVRSEPSRSVPSELGQCRQSSKPECKDQWIP